MNLQDKAQQGASEKAQKSQVKKSTEKAQENCIPGVFILVDALICTPDQKKGITKSGPNAGKPYEQWSQKVFYVSPEYTSPQQVRVRIQDYNTRIMPGKYGVLSTAIFVNNNADFNQANATLNLRIDHIGSVDREPTIVKISDELSL